MITCDLNCDMGEGIGNDAALMPFISSANIACGYHAGDHETIATTMELARKHGVAVGAHPSFPDRENFGRTEMPCTPEQVYDWTNEQLHTITEIARSQAIALHHVKPHGAMYNMAARNAQLAAAIVQAILAINRDLILYGLSGSCLISEGIAGGLRTASEVFADRTYQEDGSLTPRKLPGALIQSDEQAIAQALQMVEQGTVSAVNGKTVRLVADTVCLHGDGAHALPFAQKIYHTFQQHQIAVKAL